jgi:hypothetical protein
VGSGHGGGRKTRSRALRLIQEEEEYKGRRAEGNGSGESDLVLELAPLFIAEAAEGTCNDPPILTPGFSYQWGN